MDNLTGWAEHEDHEANAGYDDNRERYGDPCPRCSSLRWQGDCPKCAMQEEFTNEVFDGPFQSDLGGGNNPVSE